MYSVTVTPGRSSEKQSTSRSKETELYKSRRRESVPVRVLNYIRSQFQAEGVSGTFCLCLCINRLEKCN
ncbi:hypothetical protein M0804_006645 [Polistes exclamans]|nr:hypothetical protein M0804_006645 [Polistes exclamans]